MFQLKKIREITYIGNSILSLTRLFTAYGGWRIVSRSLLTNAQKRAWGLSETCKGTQILLQFQEITYGRLRFIEIKGGTFPKMRPCAKIWDTGGIADIDIRVHDMEKIYTDLSRAGWMAANPPASMPVPPPFRLDEMLMTHPEGFSIAFIKRYEPPLELLSDKNFASHVYLTAMTVKNMDIAEDYFVRQLGFKKVTELSFRFPIGKPNNFGIPQNYSHQFVTHLQMYSPDGDRETMCESLYFEGLEGYDFSNQTAPPNQGLASYHIEVENIEAYRNFILENGVKKVSHFFDFKLPPYGKVKSFRTVSPDGVWISFFSF